MGPFPCRFANTGLILLDTNLIIYGQQSWGIFDMKGNLVRKEKHDMKGQIMTMQMVETLENYSIITWSGNPEEPNMCLQTYKEKVPCNPLNGHSSMIMNQKQTRAFICENQETSTVTAFKYEDGYWVKEKEFEENLEPILMLELSKNEKWSYEAGSETFAKTSTSPTTWFSPRAISWRSLVFAKSSLSGIWTMAPSLSDLQPISRELLK